VALGVQGSLWKKQKVDSLKPFSKLKNLEVLFMSSVQLRDKNLDYIATNPELKYFMAARFAPKASFDSLRNWCSPQKVDTLLMQQSLPSLQIRQG
jgi:hypothetical protein